MLGNKGTGTDEVEIVPFQNGTEFSQGIVKGTVAVGHQGDGRRPLSDEVLPEGRHDLIGKLSGIGRPADDDQFPFGKDMPALSLGR